MASEAGTPIPNNTPHAVSVSLPTWEATVAYEEGEKWITEKMVSGYPRFYIHSIIQELQSHILKTYGRDGESCIIFSSYSSAKRCRAFIKDQALKEDPHSIIAVRILQLTTPAPINDIEASYRIQATISVVFFPTQFFNFAKGYWQHAGEGISSRQGEYVLQEFLRLERKENKTKVTDPDAEYSRFIEERFGRNLDLKFYPKALSALKKRISGNFADTDNVNTTLSTNSRASQLTEDDVYLLPTGMSAIFHSHLTLLHAFDPRKSIQFGFPYVDTLNILKKFGPGVEFYGFGEDKELDDIEARLKSGERFLGLFTEIPSNPMLKTANLERIRKLADEYDFCVIIDETVGNSYNIHALPYADIVACSLTKVFSGDSNVMGGSLVLNPQSKFYNKLKSSINDIFEDIFWAEDVIYLERNSRDVSHRNDIINENSEAVVKLFQSRPDLIKEIYYPTLVPSKKYYDIIKSETGGYGGLLSLVFQKPKQAQIFFDTLNLAKGPSLGTNFTLACPYAILAHYQELDMVEKWGLNRDMVRISIGLENRPDLLKTITLALEAAATESK